MIKGNNLITIINIIDKNKSNFEYIILRPDQSSD